MMPPAIALTIIMRLCFFCWIALFLCLQTVAGGKFRHARAHDGFHNINKEARWRHSPRQ
ncbi:uncharacterized protein LOC111080765 [Drosophila obscura]|uniref:uncharacterized protein LOC111080765 n=1 Tax=Drosophila obscura TaxID=7282 RepID=UPI001BB21624|nr:uncharacterized protein LOC111080765 [Drosophila obscura]